MVNEKNIPVKNYIILCIITILSILLVIYFYMWYRTYDSGNLNTSNLNEYLNVIQYNELDNYLIENKDAIIYVSTLNDKEAYNFEKKFKKVINKYAINNNILYLDITEELKDNNIYKQIKNKYDVNVPYIIDFKDGKVKSIFNIKDNNYDIDMLTEYLTGVGVIND